MSAGKNAPDLDGLNAVGHNVILTKPDGTPTLVNLFRMISADPIRDGGTEITIDDPKAYAAAGTGGGSFGNTTFNEIDCTRKIKVQESLEEILQRQAEGIHLLR